MGEAVKQRGCRGSKVKDRASEVIGRIERLQAYFATGVLFTKWLLGH